MDDLQSSKECSSSSDIDDDSYDDRTAPNFDNLEAKSMHQSLYLENFDLSVIAESDGEYMDSEKYCKSNGSSSQSGECCSSNHGE